MTPVTVPAIEVLPNDQVLLRRPGPNPTGGPDWYTVVAVREATVRGEVAAGEDREVPAVRLVSAAGFVWVFRADRRLRVHPWGPRGGAR